MGRRRKTIAAKPCQACQTPSTRLVRIKATAAGDWIMVCEGCWPEFAHDNPDYRYGGLWRASKRR